MNTLSTVATAANLAASPRLSRGTRVVCLAPDRTVQHVGTVVYASSEWAGVRLDGSPRVDEWPVDRLSVRARIGGGR